MERLDGIYRDRMLMVVLLVFSSMTFVIIDIGLEYLKEFWTLVLFMQFSIVLAPVVMTFSFVGIIATSILIEQAKSEIEKDKV
ncbi:hypothetical protein [Bacillus cereus]|uniref:hypothetical protein n=1 Tax=Bacillus cereus TaxID=1396 RepID=UPI00031622FA|nr:hypothetical protein [Bacillus cereus]